MRTLFISKLYEREILRWLSHFALFTWALIATVLFVRLEMNKPQPIMVAVSAEGRVRLIETQNQEFENEELREFVFEFVRQFYEWSPETFQTRVGRATDLLTEEAWIETQAEILKIQEAVQKESLVQKVKIESVDLVSEFEVDIKIKILREVRMTESIENVRVRLTLSKNQRSTKNPWGYEIQKMVRSYE